MEEITHHHHHSSSNKLEEPTTTTPLVVEGEEEEVEKLPTTLVVEVEKEVVVVVTDDDDLRKMGWRCQHPPGGFSRVRRTRTPSVIKKKKKKKKNDVVDPIAEMEKILNYRFRNKNLLNEALAQCDKPRVQTPGSTASSLSERLEFQRLEFLGDAVLGLAVATFMFINFPNILRPICTLADICKNNVSTEKFARVAIQHGFYRYIRAKVPRKVRDFALVVQDERNGVVSSEAMKAPKLLADIVESIAAAVYVDCDFDLKLFWKCFGGLLEPRLTPTILFLPEIYGLFQHCEKARKQVCIRHWRQGSQNIAIVYVNGNYVCSSYSEEEEERIAMVNAAKEALKLLSSTSDDVEDETEGTRPTCFKFRVEKEDSEDKAIKENLEKKRNQLVETKKRKRETGSEVSAEKVKGDMAINEKLEKKSNKLMGRKKRKMENVSAVSADKVMVDIAINEKLEKKTKKENGGDVSAEKVEQLLPEENSSMKNITCQSNIQEKSKKYAPIYTSKHMNTSLSSVAEVEEILSYRFRNKSHLEEALTQSSYRDPNYKGRLELLGGIVLSLAVSNFLFITYPDLEPHQLTALRDANMGSEKLARVAIRHGFYRYLHCNSPVCDAEVRDFALVVQEEGDGIVKPPMILAKIVRSIAAAIFVDCEFDFKLLWKYFCGLLEPLVTLDTFQQQPVCVLYALCHREGKHFDVKYSYNSPQHTVSYSVNGQLVGSGCSENKHIAKMTAAKEALKLWNLDSSSMNLVVDVGVKQELNELCSKNGWEMPTYKYEKEGPPHDIKCICEVKIETVPGLYLTARGVGRSYGPSARSAASMMLHDLENSEHGLVKSP